ncbi:MAG: right-handed parallel beta-helix repeat-containing protein [Thermodesulfobacteriota bacterium]|nr:right-handed parallel beta-helix repeat-containing protein [Thermodesulfobacteriota bacterium]
MKERCLKRTLIIILICLAFCPQAFADFFPSGLITSDLTLTLAGSPYVVEDNVLVMEGVTLTIEPGVEVNFVQNRSIQIDGELIARGTESDQITFTGTSWGYIFFSDTSVDATYDVNGDYTQGSILQYCLFENGGYANPDDNGAIRVDESSPFISHCDIKNSGDNGIRVYNNGASKITHNTITLSEGREISVSSNKKTIISHNQVSDNAGGIYADGDGDFTISYNTITDNTGCDVGGGIYSDTSSSATITNNTVTGNTSNDSGGGIYAKASDSSSITDNNTIANNTIDASYHGNGAYLENPTEFNSNLVIGNRAIGSGGTSGIYVEGNPEFHYNNIYDNSGYALYCGNAQGADSLDVTDCYWGTTDS